MRALLALFATLALVACKEPARSGGDFAVLAQSSPGFEQARQGTLLEFPRDHGAHPGFRIEWWYLTASLQDDQGRPFGAQWTLFRTASQAPDDHAPHNPWQSPQVYMAHFAVTTPDGHASFQRYARGGNHQGQAQAGVTSAPFSAWIDNWALESTGPGWLPMVAQAEEGDFALNLELNSDKPLVLQGAQGFSSKHENGGGSYYYSQPFLKARGTLKINGEVINVNGEAWLDHEWSSQFLQSDQAGWDWFALHLDSGEKLMLFQLRNKPGATARENFTHGVLISPDGNKLELKSSEISLSPRDYTRVQGRDLPLEWTISLPGLDRQLTVTALHPEQWMDVDFAYFEGVIMATGEGPGSNGRGYLEMTGY